MAYLLSTFCPSGTLQAILCIIFDIRPKPGLSDSGAFMTPDCNIAKVVGCLESRARASETRPDDTGSKQDKIYAGALFGYP